MKSIKKILFAIIFIAIFLCLCSFNSNVRAAIKEDSTSFNGDTYVIGSTKFNNGFVITASRAAIAGANEAYMRYLMCGGFDFDTSEIKTYYYCEFDDSWSEVNVENGELRELSEAEVKKLEESLNIFFVNNEEKTIEVSYNGTVDEDSITGWGNGEATVENGKITVPASWVINGFSFTSNGDTVDVTLSNSSSGEDLKELKEPIIKKHPTLALAIKSENVYVGEPIEFTLNINANDYAGISKSGGIYIFSTTGGAVSKWEYYNENDKKWETVSDYTNILNTSLKTEEIKCRVTFSSIGDVSLNTYMNYDGGYLSDGQDITVEVNPKSVAQVGTKYYESFTDAISAAENETITLLKDVTITEDIEIANKTIVIDLNGKTIYLGNEENVLETPTAKEGKGDNTRISATNYANISFANGKIISKGNSALRAIDNSILNVTSDVKIESYWYGIVLRNNATLNYSGEIKVTGDGFGISGNGSDEVGEATTINVTGGKIEAPKGHAFYLPQAGATIIDDGTFTADTCIGILSGSLNINGGTFTANGEYKQVSIPTSNGMKPTGDVIFAEVNSKYKGNIDICINDATLSSVNGNIVREYNTTIGNNNELAGISINGDYTTKTILNDNVNVYTATSEAAIEADGLYYSENSLANVLNNANDVKLLKNIEITEDIFVDNNVNLDLNEKTIYLGNEKNVLETPTASKGKGDNTRISVINDKVLSVSNGSVISLGNYALRATNTATLNVDNVNLKSYWYGISAQNNSTINFNSGKIEVEADGYGISGNGSDKTSFTTININGGEIIAPNGHALYLPQNGITTVTAGKLSGNTAIALKSGTLNIKGGILEANGTYVELPSDTYNGVDPTGDAIFVELNDSYYGNVVVNYTAGAITSTNGKILREYSVNGNHSTINGLEVTGGSGEKITFYCFPE